MYKEDDIEWTNERARRHWNYYARIPSQYFTMVFGANILRISDKYKQGGINNKHILDYGCGTGGLIIETNKKFKPKDYFAVDSSKISLASCQKIDANFPVITVLSNQSRIAIQDSSIDICFLVEVVEHLDNQQLDSTLVEIYRVLKKGGVLIVTTPNNENLDKSKLLCPECGCTYHKYQHLRSWNVKTLTIKFKEYLFRDIDVFETNLKTNSFITNIFLLLKRIYKRESELKNLIGVFKK